jgi:hypothetical protein
MPKAKSIKELLNIGGSRLTAITSRAANRKVVLEQVRAALPGELAAVVVSADIADGRLTVCVASATWAARLRYSTDVLKSLVGQSSGEILTAVRVKVIPPQA